MSTAKLHLTLQVSYQEGLDAYEKMKLAGANVQFKSYQGLGHVIGVQELLDAKAFCKLCLPPLTDPMASKIGATVNTANINGATLNTVNTVALVPTLVQPHPQLD